MEPETVNTRIMQLSMFFKLSRVLATLRVTKGYRKALQNKKKIINFFYRIHVPPSPPQTNSTRVYTKACDFLYRRGVLAFVYFQPWLNKMPN